MLKSLADEQGNGPAERKATVAPSWAASISATIRERRRYFRIVSTMAAYTRNGLNITASVGQSSLR